MKSQKNSFYRKSENKDQELLKLIWDKALANPSWGYLRVVRLFNEIAGFSRRAFEPVVDYSLTERRGLSIWTGFVRCMGHREFLGETMDLNDGPKFRSKEFREMIEKWRIEKEVITPGQPFHNGHIESFHRSRREELLDR